MAISMNVKGLDKVAAELNKMQDSFPRAFNKAMKEEADDILMESQMEVPVDTGELKDSGKVETSGRGRGKTFIIRYNARHAIFVHQRTEVRHYNGKARFLIDPFLRALSGMSGRVSARIARSLNL